MNYQLEVDDPISVFLNSLDELKSKDIYAYIDPISFNWRFIHDLGEFDRQNKMKLEKGFDNNDSS